MTGNPRYDQLLALIEANGYMRIEDLASRLDVSAQTIRRDIKKLSEEGILSRHHGGAGQPSSAINRDLDEREVSQVEEKRAIAIAVAERIPDRSTIFLSAGTTIECVARALLTRQDLRIITTCLRVAGLLYQRRDFEVMVPGGYVRPKNSGIVGPSAQDFLERFRADYYIGGVGAIDVNGTLLDFDINEVALMKIMIANSKHTFIAADHTKFCSSASVELGTAGDIDVLFTDKAPPTPLASLFALQQVEVVV